MLTIPAQLKHCCEHKLFWQQENSCLFKSATKSLCLRCACACGKFKICCPNANACDEKLEICCQKVRFVKHLGYAHVCDKLEICRQNVNGETQEAAKALLHILSDRQATYDFNISLILSPDFKDIPSKLQAVNICFIHFSHTNEF